MSNTLEETHIRFETLADIRREAKKTTRQVGEVLGVTQPRITQIEQEGTKDITQLELLADFYEVGFERIRLASERLRNLSKDS
jgi:transcriptional regulator with XRE-family HTH domain